MSQPIRTADEETKRRFVAHMNAVLAAVGRTGSAEDTRPEFHIGSLADVLAHTPSWITDPASCPTYPTLDELRRTEPELYAGYLAQADGTRIVSFQPGHIRSDEWGFLVLPIATALAVGRDVYFIEDDGTVDGAFYEVDEDSVQFGGFIDVKHYTKNHLHPDEIKAALGGKILINAEPF